jgi:hypothetical protein
LRGEAAAAIAFRGLILLTPNCPTLEHTRPSSSAR